jgi:hypothetical protein
MNIETFLQYLASWINLLVLPFQHFDLLWRMIPVYLNGLLACIYFGPSNTAATFGGLTALWAGADWIRGYSMGGVHPSSTNRIIAILFCIYGISALIVGLTKRKKLYCFFGRRSILTFFAISFYPIQAGFAYFSTEAVVGIFITAIPVIALLELFSLFARKHILRLENESSGKNS